MAFNKSIPNFIGGKTQEPFTQRQDNELQEEINCFNSVNNGLIRRPGSYIVGDLPLTSDNILNVNKIEHKDGFLIVDQNKNIKFFRKDGTEYITSFESPQTESNYNAYVNGQVDLGFLNLNDLTYLYNRNVETKINESINQPDDFLDLTSGLFGYIYIKNGLAAKRYTTNISLAWAEEFNPPFLIGDDLSYFVEGEISNKQIARKMISRREQWGVNGNNTYHLIRSGHYDVPITPTIKTVSGGLNNNAFNITIIGDIYNEQDDTFTRTEKVYNFPAGVSEITLNEKWGSIKYTEADIATPDPMKIDIEFSVGNSTFNYSYNLFYTGLNYGYIDEMDAFPKGDIVAINRHKEYNNNPPYRSFTSNISTSDEADGTNMYQIFGTMESLDLLPINFFHNTKIKISGNPGTEEDDYFVLFKATGETETGVFGSGVWEETGNKVYEYDLKTMPFSILIDDTLQTVKINDGGWKERVVGDETTNRDPYFINKKINDMFIYGSRLCFLSGGDKIDLSGTNDFFNFYRTTVLTVPETDRISIIVNSDKLINLTRSTPFNESVLLIDDDTQFIMTYEGGLSINTLQVQEISSFNTKSDIKPIRTNDSLFFISDYANNSQVIKFSSRDIRLVQGLEITEKIRSLLPNAISSTCINNANDMLFLHKRGENKIYMYTYKVFQGEGEYGSWCELDFTGYNILDIECIDDELFMFCNGGGPNKVTLLKMNLSNDTSYENGFENEFFRLHLDKKATGFIAADPRNIDGNGNQKQFLVVDWNIPFTLINPDNVRLVATGENGNYFNYGHSFRIIDVTENIDGNIAITFENPRFDLAASDPKYIVDQILVGELFDSEAELSKLNLKNREGLPMNSGTTQLLGLNLTFGNTGGFKVNTEITNAGSYDEIFTGKVVGTQSAVIGQINVEDGSKSFYLGSEKNDIKIRIRNLDYLPFEIQSGEYEVEYDSRTSTF